MSVNEQITCETIFQVGETYNSVLSLEIGLDWGISTKGYAASLIANKLAQWRSQQRGYAESVIADKFERKRK